MLLKPIFIAGCDRSGTTMLGDLLGANSHAIVTPESQFVHELLLLMHNRHFNNSKQVAQWLQNHFFFSNWHIDDGLQQLIELDDPRQTVLNIVTRYQQKNNATKNAARFWIDHTPDNFKYYAVLKYYFPEAHYIHIVRDGRAVYNSVKSLKWGPNNAYMSARYWSERIRQALLVEMAEAQNCLRLRYEDIVSDTETCLQLTCDRFALPYEAAMVYGGGLKLPGFTKGQHKLVGKKPDASRIHSWQKKLKQKEINDFESYFWSKAYLEMFNYPLLLNQPHQPSSIRMLWSYLHDFVMYAVHRLQHKMMEGKVIRGEFK